MSKLNYLSENSSTDSEIEYPRLERLNGYEISGPCDKRLVKSLSRRVKVKHRNETADMSLHEIDRRI